MDPIRIGPVAWPEWLWAIQIRDSALRTSWTGRCGNAAYSVSSSRVRM